MKRISKKVIRFSRNPYNGVLMTRSVALFYFCRKYKVFSCASIFTKRV